jgi:DNA ligase-1
MSLKPMLASEADLDKLRYPLIASPKLDGIRALVANGMLLSRTLKLIPNDYVRSMLSHVDLEGFDGELIVGSATAKDVYRQTTSGVMSHDGYPKFTYYVFDLHNEGELQYGKRRVLLEKRLAKVQRRFPNVILHEQEFIKDAGMLMGYEAAMLEAGYEGLILRDPLSPYKYGRASMKQGWMLKLKRFQDDEAEIIGVQEMMHNANEAKRDELGRTKRSSAKAGLVGTGLMGALHVRDLKSGVEFYVGTGFDDEDRAKEWKLGSIIKYKSFKIGVKDAPRHPVYLGLRDRRDM